MCTVDGGDDLSPVRSPVTRKRQAPGTDRRSLLLDAAEQVVAEKGYWGATVREIADVAGVNLGLINYYFGSKPGLIREVIERRRPDLLTLMKDRIDRGRQEADPLRGIVHAFVSAIIELLNDHGKGWRNYMRVLSQLITTIDAPDVGEPLGRVDETAKIMIGALADALPNMPVKDLLSRVYILETSLIFLVQDRGALDRRTNGLYSVDRLPDLVGPLVDAWMSVLMSQGTEAGRNDRR